MTTTTQSRASLADDTAIPDEHLIHILRTVYPAVDRDRIQVFIHTLIGKLTDAGSEGDEPIQYIDGRIGEHIAHLIAYHFDIQHGDYTTNRICGRQTSFARMAADPKRVGSWNVTLFEGSINAPATPTPITTVSSNDWWSARAIASVLAGHDSIRRAEIRAAASRTADKSDAAT